MVFPFKDLSLLVLGMGLIFFFPINLESAEKIDIPSLKKMDSSISDNDEKKQKAVIGFHGKSKTLTEIWLKKQNLFNSIKYTGGQPGRFTDQGTLKGILKNGR